MTMQEHKRIIHMCASSLETTDRGYATAALLEAVDALLDEALARAQAAVLQLTRDEVRLLIMRIDDECLSPEEHDRMVDALEKLRKAAAT